MNRGCLSRWPVLLVAAWLQVTPLERRAWPFGRGDGLTFSESEQWETFARREPSNAKAGHAVARATHSPTTSMPQQQHPQQPRPADRRHQRAAGEKRAEHGRHAPQRRANARERAEEQQRREWPQRIYLGKRRHESHVIAQQCSQQRNREESPSPQKPWTRPTQPQDAPRGREASRHEPAQCRVEGCRRWYQRYYTMMQHMVRRHAEHCTEDEQE